MKEKEIIEPERKLYWEVWEEQYLTPSMTDEIENMFNFKIRNNESN